MKGGNNMAKETMENFIPKNAVKLCNKCKHHIRGTITCEAYPDRIPHKQLISDYCKDFQPREEDHKIYPMTKEMLDDPIDMDYVVEQLRKRREQQATEQENKQ